MHKLDNADDSLVDRIRALGQNHINLSDKLDDLRDYEPKTKKAIESLGYRVTSLREKRKALESEISMLWDAVFVLRESIEEEPLYKIVLEEQEFATLVYAVELGMRDCNVDRLRDEFRKLHIKLTGLRKL